MKRIIIFWVITLTTASCGDSFLNSRFKTERQFTHNLQEDLEECQRQNAGTEINCVEHVTFHPDGTVDCLLGGSDIMIRSSYKKNNNKVEIDDESGLSEKLEFDIESDSVLILKSNKSRWVSI